MAATSDTSQNKTRLRDAKPSFCSAQMLDAAFMQFENSCSLHPARTTPNHRPFFFPFSSRSRDVLDGLGRPQKPPLVHAGGLLDQRGKTHSSGRTISPTPDFSNTCNFELHPKRQAPTTFGIEPGTCCCKCPTGSLLPRFGIGSLPGATVVPVPWTQLRNRPN